MKEKKKGAWRILLGVVSLGYITFLWVKKDIAALYSTMPAEQILPLMVTTIGVSLLKAAGITAVILLMKWILGKKKR